MVTTVKKISVCLTKESKKQLDELIKKTGETQSQLIKLALAQLYEKMK